MPAGSSQYWSWLFAAPALRAPLLGVYALRAEWRALVDNGTDAAVGQLKLTWWREELDRAAGGAPLHPITRHLQAVPDVDSAAFLELAATVAATRDQLSGVPLETAAALPAHADALYGAPLRVAARLAGIPASPSAHACTASLAAAQYLTCALADCRRGARAGRIAFAVDELLAAGIDNHDLAADAPPPRLAAYLHQLQCTAVHHYAAAAAALNPREMPPLRHLLVLTTLGARHARLGRAPANADFRMADLYNAWTAARRAAAAG